MVFRLIYLKQVWLASSFNWLMNAPASCNMNFVSVLFLLLLLRLSKCALENNYSVNFLWINKDKSDTIFPISHRQCEDVIDQPHQVLQQWTQFNNAVYLWYDSEFVTPKAVKDFKEEFPKVTLRDIRQLPIVKQHEQVILDKKITVYMKIDLLKFMIAFDELLRNTFDYFVFVDFSIPQDVLFDVETVEKLDNYGFVFRQNHNSPKEYENSFFIFKKDLDVLRALKFLGIDYFLGKYRLFIYGRLHYQDRIQNVIDCHFHDMRFMMYYLMQLKGLGHLYAIEPHDFMKKYTNGIESVETKRQVCENEDKDFAAFSINAYETAFVGGIGEFPLKKMGGRPSLKSHHI